MPETREARRPQSVMRSSEDSRHQPIEGPVVYFYFFFKFVKLKWIKESTFVLVSFKVDIASQRVA